MRQQVVTSVQSVRRKENVTAEEKKAMKELQEDQSIVIVPADKGRVTVVMDKDEYVRKNTSHLSDEDTYAV